MKSAIILSAGKSNNFAPFTYEKPKGLFCVKGEILIERQIEQLKEAGIDDIYIVVGYMKEKFFYLEKKYGVKLIVNNLFSKKGNLYSLYVAREHLNNTFICCADHYFSQNPFLYENKENISYRACKYLDGKFKEFAVCCSDANVITEVNVGGEDSLAMVGPAYVNDKFCRVFKELVEQEIDDFGVDSMFWEEFYMKHIKQLTLYKNSFSTENMYEFENIDDLRRFDSEFLINVDSDIIDNICRVLNCKPNEIINIEVINAGLTNVSFSFEVANEKYVYRHPGGTAGNLVDRQSEFLAQNIAKEKGIDSSYIYMDLSGWKISHYITKAQNCYFEKKPEQLKIAMDYLRRLHAVEVNDDIKIFDNVEEGKRLMKIASLTKGNLEKEFSDLVSKVEYLYEYIKTDADRLGYKLVLCHNDVYSPNYLVDDQNNIYLIDWEYAGRNYAANDLGCIICRYDWTDEEISNYIESYFERKLSKDEHRFYFSFIPISAFYWFCWGLYKGSVGDDDSFFFLPSYRNLVRFIDSALEGYEEKL